MDWTQYFVSYLVIRYRLGNEITGRKALKEFDRPCKKPPERPKETWLNCIRKTLANSNIGMTFRKNETIIKELEVIYEERARWRKILRVMKL